MSTSTIYNAIITSLQAIDGTGSYTYDFSGTDSILEGALHIPHITPPVLMVSVLDLPEEVGPELGSWNERMNVRIVGYVEGTADTANARVTAAMDLLDDVKRAMRLAHAPSGALETLVNFFEFANTAAFDGNELNMQPAYGVISTDLSVRWFEDPP